MKINRTDLLIMIGYSLVAFAISALVGIFINLPLELILLPIFILGGIPFGYALRERRSRKEREAYSKGE